MFRLEQPLARNPASFLSSAWFEAVKASTI